MNKISSVLDNNNILVSIVCTTYNHERFIADALNGFVRQRTSFRYEVVVGDDCSTDGTASIVRDFASRYPSLFDPVFHSENQHSQGKSVLEPLIRRARGKYVAICEGDDYWSDPDKLNKQISYMEGHPSCSFCFTNARKLDCRTGRLLDPPMLPATSLDQAILERSHDLGTREMLGISFPPTASFVFRKSCWERRPIFPKGTFTGDRYLQLVLTEGGYAHYLDEVTCVYRVGNPDSMMGMWSRSRGLLADAIRGYLRLYEEFDRYTEGRYSDAIEPLALERRYSLLTLEGRYEELRSPEYRSLSRSLGLRSRAAYLIRTSFPNAARALEGMRRGT